MSTEFGVISRQAILEHRQRQIELGFTFPLTATSLGMDETIRARVRRLSLMDKAIVSGLPQQAQDAIWAGIRVLRDAQKKRRQQGDEPGEFESFDEMIASNDKTMPGANAYCLASFIDPPLVEFEHQVNDVPGALWIEDIHEDDRLAFWIACQDPSSDQAKRLKMFRPSGAIEAHGTISDVGYRPAHEPAGIHVPDRPAEPMAPETFVDLGNASRGD